MNADFDTDSEPDFCTCTFATTDIRVKQDDYSTKGS